MLARIRNENISQCDTSIIQYSAVFKVRFNVKVVVFFFV